MGIISESDLKDSLVDIKRQIDILANKLYGLE